MTNSVCVANSVEFDLFLEVGKIDIELVVSQNKMVIFVTIVVNYYLSIIIHHGLQIICVII